MYSTFTQTYSERILIPMLDSTLDCTVLSAPFVVGGWYALILGIKTCIELNRYDFNGPFEFHLNLDEDQKIKDGRE